MPRLVVRNEMGVEGGLVVGETDNGLVGVALLDEDDRSADEGDAGRGQLKARPGRG